MKIRGKWQQNHLTDVWFVPKISRNLFSISQNVEKGFKFMADESGCQFKKNGETKMIGRKTERELYVLNMRVKIPDVAAEVYIASTYDTLQLWHERLCHQNKTHVREILKKQGIEVKIDEEFCDRCVYGKQHRESFNHRKNRPINPGGIINADVCGPMQEESIGGSRYFVCCKDDFSKFRRFFLQNLRLQIAYQSL